MQTSNNILFLTNEKIDKERWDANMQSSENGLIYGYSYYLDHVCKGWGALAANDYSWIMPICFKKKYGILYLYQPPFTQQLGIFYQPNTFVPYLDIIQHLQKKYAYCDVNWNYTTKVDVLLSSICGSSANNFILDLNKDYDEIFACYHKDLVKNLKRSKAFNIKYEATDEYGTCIQLYKNHYQKRMPHLKNIDFENIYSLFNNLRQKNQVICRQATNENNEILSTVLLLKDNRRIYNLLNTTTLLGRKYEANHLLLDAVIKEFSPSNLLLDFEGSDLPGVKSFYENFGAVNQPYFHVRYNILKWPLKYFKK